MLRQSFPMSLLVSKLHTKRPTEAHEFVVEVFGAQQVNLELLGGAHFGHLRYLACKKLKKLGRGKVRFADALLDHRVDIQRALAVLLIEVSICQRSPTIRSARPRHGNVMMTHLAPICLAVIALKPTWLWWTTCPARTGRLQLAELGNLFAELSDCVYCRHGASRF